MWCSRSEPNRRRPRPSTAWRERRRRRQAPGSSPASACAWSRASTPRAPGSVARSTCRDSPTSVSSRWRRCWRWRRRRRQTAWFTPRSSSFYIPVSRSISSSTCWIGRRRAASPSNRRRNRARRRRQRRASRHTGSRPSPGMKWPPRSSCWHRSSPSGACSRSVRGGNCAAKARRATGSGSLFPARGSSDTRNWNRSSMTARRWFATPGASAVSTGWSASRSTNAPILQALRADRPFAVPPADVPLIGPCLAPIARQDFLALMTFRDGAESFERSATA